MHKIDFPHIDLVSERAAQLTRHLTEKSDDVMRKALDKHVPGWSEEVLQGRCRIERRSGVSYYYVDDTLILEMHPADFTTENGELSISIPYRIL